MVEGGRAVGVTQATAAGPYLDTAAQRAEKSTGPLVGFIAALIGTAAVVVLFPDRPSPRGALVVPAFVLSVSIVVVPIMRALTGAATRMNAENFVALGFVYWLLLDLIQGAYDLSDASDQALRLAIIAIGLSAAAMWLGVAARQWRLPRGLLALSNTSLDSATTWKLR